MIQFDEIDYSSCGTINIVIISVVIASVIILLLLISSGGIPWLREDFATKYEKGAAIKQWFESNPNPTYTQYKRDIGVKSNIVEYEDALLLFQKDKFTSTNIEKII